jgi:PPOX class probable F420-dependent enzyme
VSDPLAEPRPAERLAIEPIVWLTTAGADGQPQSSPVWFHWDGSAFWLRTQVAARKVTNIRANPRVALHLADDGNGGDIVTVEGTAELRDGWSDDVSRPSWPSTTRRSARPSAPLSSSCGSTTR